MACNNSVYLVCCYDPTRSFLACNPNIDGVPNSSFTPGNHYVGIDPSFSPGVGICYSASSTPVGTVINYENNIYLSTTDCATCQYDYAAGCPPLVTTFADAILVNCCDPTDTLEARVPDTYTPGTISIRYNDKCWIVQSFGGSGGLELLGAYDGCIQCNLYFPCCECVEMNIGPALFLPGFADGGNVFVDYTSCSGSSETITATSVTNEFNICHESGTTITTSFTVGGSPFSTTTYPWDPLFTGPPGEVSATTISSCTGDPCGLTPSPSPSPTPTPTPTITLTPTPTPTITPTISPSASETVVNLLSPLSYTISITGGCGSDSADACIIVKDGIPGYTVDWISPSLGIGPCKTNLSPGTTYVVRINDSQAPVNNELYVNVNVSTGLNLFISQVVDTTCGLDNGQVTIGAQSDDFNITYSLYSGATLISSQFTNNGIAYFAPLPSGNYYVQGVSDAGCTGTSASFVVNPSTPFDFGFYVINDTQCASPTGKIYVTGQTGNAPYTYLWNNNQTTSSITGLTSGTYNVTVTDSGGCSLNKSVFVDFVPSLGLGSWSGTSPTCFTNDGSLTLTITGGTGPYLYSGSNGTTFVSYSQVYTFTSLSAGPFFVSVTDAALCKVTFGTTLITPNTFYDVSLNVTNSQCSSNNGSVNIGLQGGSPPYTYVLSSVTSSITATTNSTQYLFTNLSNGTYNVTITDGGSCPYSQNVIVSSVNLFNVSYSATTSTCGQPNGTLTLMTTSGGTLPYIYTLSNGQSITTNSLNVTFSSLLGGEYSYSIAEAGGCTITGGAVVPEESVLEFSLFPTSCGVSGSGGTITALITSGQPPFTYNWSSNVDSNPQEVYVTGLTDGSYSLTITDSNGCVKSRSVLIKCSPVITTYQIFNMCESEFGFTSGTKRGMVQMLNEGFNDLVSPQDGCILTASTFTIEVEVSGNTYTDLFYTGETLLDVPTDAVYFQAVEDLLLTIPGVTGVTIDPVTSKITIESGDPLSGQGVTIKLIIGYSILCPTPCP